MTTEEKEYLKMLLKKELEHFKNEKDRAKECATLGFIAAQEKYEMFVQDLLKKLS